MKATDFAYFFDLRVEFNSEEYANEEDYYPSKYIVWDTMGYYTPWFIDDVSDLTWCVDTMTDSYILDDLCDEYGFDVSSGNPYRDSGEKTVYEAAADFATEHNISYADVVRCIANYEEIEDDVALSA